MEVDVLDFEVPSRSGLYNPSYADFWEFYSLNPEISEEDYEALFLRYVQFFSDHDIELTESYDALEEAIPEKDQRGRWQFDAWSMQLYKFLDAGHVDFSPLIITVPLTFELLGIEDLAEASDISVQQKYSDFLAQFKDFVETDLSLGRDDVAWSVWIIELDEPHTSEMAWLIAQYSFLTTEASDEEIRFEFRVDGSIDWTDP